MNLLVGYLLLHREKAGQTSLVLYFVAMSLHFMASDYGMRGLSEAYDRRGRRVISGAVALGWVLGLFIDLPPAGIGFLFAFLAGGIKLNTLKTELPENRSSRFGAFPGRRRPLLCHHAGRARI
ncbi:hypothetical protein [Croceicoccus ponticola]|uniref:hypothetical protein n=1 Tax=Croceicoccus ponticola TaxID=2217664 RepID=UPI00196A1E98|nr:hypothetical protein [Croceicoccus ponticola]